MTAVPTVTLIGPRALPHLVVTGSPRQRGYQRGVALRGMIESRIERAILEMAKGSPLAASRVIADRFEKVLAWRDPPVLETLRGLSEGSGIDWEDYRVAVLGAGGWFRLDCSVFAATGPATRDGELILGKNGDLDPPFMTDEDLFAQTVRPDSGHPYLELGVYPERAHQPDGMNAHGLTVVGCGQRATDGRRAHREKRDIGVTIYDIMHRLFSQCASVDEAVEVLRESPRGYSGRTLILGDATGRWIKAEVTYGQIALFEPEQERTFPANFVCAGVSGTFSSPDLKPLITTRSERPSSYVRYDRYMDQLTRKAGSIDLEFAKTLLRDTHPERGENSICKADDHPTLESFIFRPQSLEIWATKGAPDLNRFEKLPAIASLAEAS